MIKDEGIFLAAVLVGGPGCGFRFTIAAELVVQLVLHGRELHRYDFAPQCDQTSHRWVFKHGGLIARCGVDGAGEISAPPSAIRLLPANRKGKGGRR